MKAIFLLIACALALCGDFYVSPKGRDNNPGTRAKPFATLERARDALRAAKGSGGTVWLLRGTYRLTRTFLLTAGDSGSASAPAVYRAAPGAKVEITGGQRISGFRKWKGRIVETDLPRQGITDYGKLTPRGFGKPRQPAALELFFGGKPMTLAQWPNRGWALIATAPKDGGWFGYFGDRPAGWTKAPDVWVHGYWTWDWADSYAAVASINTAEHQILTVKPGGVYGYKVGQRYQVLNLLEELDEPGEWYLDRASGRLYFWPPAPGKKAEADVSLLEEPMVALQGASYITFDGLTFEYTRGNAIEIQGGTDNLVSHCTICDIGNSAVSIHGGTRNGVADSEIADTGDGGILLEGGDRPTLTPAGNYAVRNHIHDFSRWDRTYTPGIQLAGVGNRAVGNLIDHAPHAAILVAGNDHLIADNDIHTVAVETGDVGAYYLGRDWTARGNTVRHNFFHNLGHGDVNAVYLDDCASGNIVDGNIIQGVHRGVMIGGGRDNRIENNIFDDCDIAIHLDARGLGWAKMWFDGRDNTLFNELKAMPYRESPWKERYPQLLTLPSDDPAMPKGNVVAGNQCYGGRRLALYDHMTEAILAEHGNTFAPQPRPIDSAWVKGIGLPVYAEVVDARLATAGPNQVKLTVENQGRQPVSGIYDVWLYPESAAKLRSPAAIPFRLQPGERTESTIEVEHTGPLTVGVQRRGEILDPAGIHLK